MIRKIWEIWGKCLTGQCHVCWWQLPRHLGPFNATWLTEIMAWVHSGYGMDTYISGVLHGASWYGGRLGLIINHHQMTAIDRNATKGVLISGGILRAFLHVTRYFVGDKRRNIFYYMLMGILCISLVITIDVGHFINRSRYKYRDFSYIVLIESCWKCHSSSQL